MIGLPRPLSSAGLAVFLAVSGLHGTLKSHGSGFDSLREHHDVVQVRLLSDKTPSAAVPQTFG